MGINKKKKWLLKYNFCLLMYKLRLYHPSATVPTHLSPVKCGSSYRPNNLWGCKSTSRYL